MSSVNWVGVTVPLSGKTLKVPYKKHVIELFALPCSGKEEIEEVVDLPRTDWITAEHARKVRESTSSQI